MAETARDVVVVGGGPAGMAAAGRAAEGGCRVLLADENQKPGGQIWRSDVFEPPYPQMLPWQYRVTERHVEVWAGAQVAAFPAPGRALIDTPHGAREVRYSKLIFATGGRERFLPFPGWTLPGVMGAGGLQALAKSGWPMNGRRVVVAGTGPLLLAVAAYLRRRGAKILAVAEQACARAVWGFAVRVLGEGGKRKQALGLRGRLIGVPYLTSSWPVKAEGDGKLERVTLADARGRLRVEACDYLACGFGLMANVEAPALLGCRMDGESVAVGEMQETSVDGVYAAGEVTGVAGVDCALIEGEIAGFAAAGNVSAAGSRFAARERHRRFARRMEAAFALRSELKKLAQPDTILCRCEDVSFGRIERASGWREAKLHTRCGMGPCQGRICGGAASFLFEWKVETARYSSVPVDISTLIRDE